MKLDIERIIRKYGLHKYPNVIGWSNELKPRIKNGKEMGEECIRIYVSRKIPEKELNRKFILPKQVEDIGIDVVEIGVVEALAKKKTKKIDKTDFFRPVIFGISIGNGAITAGTNGWAFEDRKGNIFLGSNAHVVADDPLKPPSKVKFKSILQPGPYDIREHGWNTYDPKFFIGTYVWHQQIYAGNSGCPIASGLSLLYNSVASLVGAKTRLMPILDYDNHIDFGVYEPVEEYKLEFPDFDNEGYLFYGLGFAGSDRVSIVCKAIYIVDAGYTPVDRDVASEYLVGDKVVKSGRTTCFTEAEVIDASASIRVWYDYTDALFKDVVLTTPMLQGGDSGSSIWIEAL